MDRGQVKGPLPGHRVPLGGGCVLHPEETIEIWADGQRYMRIKPAWVSCVDPDNHVHDLDDDDEIRSGVS